MPVQLNEIVRHLRAAVLEINLEWHQRITPFAHPAPQTINLAAMHQQFARPRLPMTELASRCVGANMDAVQKGLAVFYPCIAVTQIDAMVAQRLDFGAEQRESGLQRFLNKEIVARFAIVSDELAAVFGGLFLVGARHLFCHPEPVAQRATVSQQAERSEAEQTSPRGAFHKDLRGAILFSSNPGPAHPSARNIFFRCIG